MPRMDTHVPVKRAKIEKPMSNIFLNNLHLKKPRLLSQHDIVSTRAGIEIPRKEKNIAPTREMKGSRVGTAAATTTAEKKNN